MTTLHPTTVDDSIYLPLATPAERERYGEIGEQVGRATWDVIRKIVWVLRHEDRYLGNIETFGEAIAHLVNDLYDQRHVYVVAVESCECEGSKPRALRWDMQEGVRDRMMDALVSDVVETGDLVTTYTLDLPNCLGLMSDDGVDESVFDSIVEPGPECHDVVRMRHGQCPECGRSHDDAPVLSAEETLDKVIDAVLGNADPLVVASEVERALRSAGHLLDVEPDFEDFVS